MKSQAPLYNLEFLNQVYNSDNEIIEQIKQIFLENIPKYIDDLTHALVRQNWSEVSFTAHKIKSSIRLFNITEIIDEVVQLEQYSKAMTELETLPAKIEYIIRVLKDVEIEMKKNLND